MSNVIDEVFERVKLELERLSPNDQPMILDAATGAGICTQRLASMLRRGKIITIDNDSEAWTRYAHPRLESSGLLERVEFRKMDIADLSGIPADYFDLIFSGATLSAIGLNIVDGIRELHRVAKPNALLIIYDLLPQESPRTLQQEYAVMSWRLAKAVDVLCGRQHYEELPVKWVERRLVEAGFVIEGQITETEWNLACEESIQELIEEDDCKDIADRRLHKAFTEVLDEVKQGIRQNGMANHSRRYGMWARKKLCR